MPILDSVTIALCAVLILLIAMSSFTDIFFRKIRTKDVDDNVKQEPVSVIMVADNNSFELKENLPAFFSQDYPAGFEVIVVVCKDEDGTSDVLNTFAGHKNLYTTYVPDSSRYVSRRKLAVTLGVKAAKHERILLTDACCRPRSDRWIAAMSSQCGEGVDMVFGYSNYDDTASRFKRFNRLHREYAMMCDASAGRAYGMAGNNLMFRKSLFMQGDGFRDNLKYLRGEYDFILNKYASESNVAVCTDPDSFIVEAAPTPKEWKNKNLFYQETRKHLRRRFMHRLNFNLDMSSLHLCLLAGVGSAVYGVLSMRAIALEFGLIALVLPLILRTLNAKRAMQTLPGEIGYGWAVLFEIYTIWHNLIFAIRYKLSDKNGFISHKL